MTKTLSRFGALILCAALMVGTLAAQTPPNLTGSNARFPDTERSALNVLRVASAVNDGETVTIGPVVYEVDTQTAPTITAGNQRVDLHGGSTATATQTLTSDGTVATAADTVTIGAKVYTLVASLTPTEGQVLIVSGNADATLLNLIRAINHTGTPGTDYSVAVANTQVSAAPAVTSHAFAVTSLVPGAPANSVATTETSTHLAWGNTTLLGGVSPTASEFTTAFVASVNATNVLGFTYGATLVSANEVLVTSFSRGANVTACTETMAGSNNAWASATMYGGDSTAENTRKLAILNRAANATEAALLTMHFLAPFTPASAVVQVRTSTGVAVAFDGTTVISGNRVDVKSTGATNVASTNVVTVIAGN